MKLGWLLVACVGCSQAVPPPVGSTQGPPCPAVSAARPEAASQPPQAVAPAPEPTPEVATSGPAITPEIESLPSPELDGSIAFTEYNEALDRAKPPWEHDAAVVIARALDAAGDAHTTITIELLRDGRKTTDGANHAKATIIRDGFADDSIKGTRHRLELRLQPDRNVWRITAASADWRCHRGHADYSTVLCK